MCEIQFGEHVLRRRPAGAVIWLLGYRVLWLVLVRATCRLDIMPCGIPWIPYCVGYELAMNAMMQTKLCDGWRRGQCRFGDRCNFAHGDVELKA